MSSRQTLHFVPCTLSGIVLLLCCFLNSAVLAVENIRVTLDVPLSDSSGLFREMPAGDQEFLEARFDRGGWDEPTASRVLFYVDHQLVSSTPTIDELASEIHAAGLGGYLYRYNTMVFTLLDNFQFFHMASGDLYFLAALRAWSPDGGPFHIDFYAIYDLSDIHAPKLSVLYVEATSGASGCFFDCRTGTYAEVVPYPSTNGLALLIRRHLANASRVDINIGSTTQFLTRSNGSQDIAMSYNPRYQDRFHKTGAVLPEGIGGTTDEYRVGFVVASSSGTLTWLGPNNYTPTIAILPSSVVHYDVSYVLDSNQQTVAADIMLELGDIPNEESNVASIDMLDWGAGVPQQDFFHPVAITADANQNGPHFQGFSYSSFAHLDSGQPIISTAGPATSFHTTPSSHTLLAPQTLRASTSNSLKYESDISYNGQVRWASGQTLRALAPIESYLTDFDVPTVVDISGFPLSGTHVTKNHKDGSITVRYDVVHSAGAGNYVVSHRIPSVGHPLPQSFGTGSITITPPTTSERQLRYGRYELVGPNGAPVPVEVSPDKVYRVRADIALNDIEHPASANSELRLQVHDRRNNYIAYRSFNRSDFPVNGTRTLEVEFMVPPGVVSVSPLVDLLEIAPFESSPQEDRKVDILSLVIEEVAVFDDLLLDQAIYEWEMVDVSWQSNSLFLFGDDHIFGKNSLYFNPDTGVEYFKSNGEVKVDHGEAVFDGVGVRMRTGNFSIIGSNITAADDSGKPYENLLPGLYRLSVWCYNLHSLPRHPGVKFAIRASDSEGNLITDGIPQVEFAGARGHAQAPISPGTSVITIGSRPIVGYLDVPDNWPSDAKISIDVVLVDSLVDDSSYLDAPSPLNGSLTIHRMRLDRVY